jgi:outer membrane receptor protein involved in Fe transport
MTSRRLYTSLAVLFVFLVGVPGLAQAQAPAVSFQLPPLIVTAQKEAADAQGLPVSLTPFSEQTLQNTGATIVSDLFAPNVYFTEFTARKLSNPRFRGIGTSPANPAVATYFDGVPQFNTNSSSIDLIDVGQVEFVRGPQSALFGRNSIGGLINVTSARPSLSGWTGGLSVPFANFSSREVRGNVAGPVVDGKLGISLAMQYGQRDGYTVNDLTGNDVDSRDGFSAKGQVLWTPSRNWETRVIVNGERNRDGDYALSDLGGLRANPYHVMHDFEGFTNRDIFATTILNRHESARFSVTSTTGFLKWKTDDATDLDYTPLPLIVRNNNEESFQFTQEVRVASAQNAAIRLSDGAALKWQAGVFLFTQNYEQNAVNNVAPFTFSPFINVPLAITFAGCPAGRLRHRRLRAGHRNNRQSRRPDRRRARGQRAEGCLALHVLHSANRSAAGPRDRRELLERVAVVFRGGPHSAGEDGICCSDPWLQGGRLQPGVAGRQRSLRRRACVERRRRSQDDVGIGTRDGECQRLPHQLGRPAVERA